MTTKEKTLFDKLNAIDVSKHVEKKGSGSFKLSYLSWVWAWDQIKKIDPEATKVFTEFDEYNSKTGSLTGRKVDYMLTEQGCYVECTVTINGHKETETLYVMDFKNNAVKDPDMGQINKTKQRCFVKAVALHGLGLYIYAGEDLPNKDDQPVKQKSKPEIEKISQKEIEQINRGIKALSDLMSMDVEAVAKLVKEKNNYDNIETINKETASKIIKYLSESITDLKKDLAKEETA